MTTYKKKTKVPKSQGAVPKFCQRVIEDVVTNMRQAFLDDGVGEQALQRMLHMWRSKILSSKSIDLLPAIPPPEVLETGSDEESCSPSKSSVSQSCETFDDEEPCSSSSKPSVSIQKKTCATLGSARQLDGILDDSDEDDDDNDLDYNNDDDEEADEEEAENSEAEEQDDEEPLNSGDDLTDDETIEQKFEAENVGACQYDVVSRTRNKWKFIFRDGIMKIHGKEFLFKRAEGDAVW